MPNLSSYLRTYETHTPKDVVVKRTHTEGEHSPFCERPVGGRGGGGGGTGVGREEGEDVLREEERVGRTEDGVLRSTREETLRRSQVTEDRGAGAMGTAETLTGGLTQCTPLTHLDLHGKQIFSLFSWDRDSCWSVGTVPSAG